MAASFVQIAADRVGHSMQCTGHDVPGVTLRREPEASNELKNLSSSRSSVNVTMANLAMRRELDNAINVATLTETSQAGGL